MKKLPLGTILAIALAGTVILSGCGLSDADLQRQVTPDEAKSVLNEVVSATVSEDIQALADKFGASVSMANQHVEQAGGWDNRPEGPPAVVDSRVIPARRLSGRSYSLGGRVLVLEGTNGKGEQYRSEFLVSWDAVHKKLIAQYPIYWLQMKISDSQQTTTSSNTTS